MNLRHIEIFHSVYVNGSVSAAARALHVSQPSVSKVLKHAEDRLGFRLFERVKGRLTPTDEAHALFREVDDIYSRIGSLRTAAKNLRSGSEGHLRVAVLPALGLGAAPAAVARFRSERPGVTFDIRTLNHDEVMRSLYERESDFAVAYDMPPHPRLRSERLVVAELGLLYRSRDFPGAPSRVDLARLKGGDFISLAESGPLGRVITEEFDRRDIDVKDVVSVRTFYVAAALVACGAGMSVVDEFTARWAPHDGVEFRPLQPALSFEVQCVYLEDRPPSTLAHDFIAVLRATLGAPHSPTL